MIHLLLLLAAYGLCFGLMNKALVLHRGSFLLRMFDCAFCTGIHCGWITWLAGWVLVGPSWLGAWGLLPLRGTPEVLVIVVSLVVWVFGVGGWCYLLDTWARKLEGGA